MDRLLSMPPLSAIADADRQWFESHPNRRYRVRYATLVEHQAFGADPDLVLLIRFLGRDRLVYQPVRLPAPLPADEPTIARIFTQAVADLRPVPSLAPPEPAAV